MKIKFYAALLLFGSVLLASCQKEKPRPVYAPYNNGYPYGPYPYYPYPYPNPYPNNYPDTNRYVLPIAPYYVNGYVRYYYNGSNIKISEGNYQNGVPSGYWKFYYPDGKLMREGNFENGTLSGYWKFYYPNGRKQEEGNYSNNQRTGTWKFYNPNGSKQAEISYS